MQILKLIILGIAQDVLALVMVQPSVVMELVQVKRHTKLALKIVMLLVSVMLGMLQIVLMMIVAQSHGLVMVLKIVKTKHMVVT